MRDKSRILNIVNELLKNSLEADSSLVDLSIEYTPDYFEITIQDNGTGLDESTEKIVVDSLNQPHEGVYDEYYSGLAGSNRNDKGLNIVGYQIDEASVESSEEGTTIRVRRDGQANKRN